MTRDSSGMLDVPALAGNHVVPPEPSGRSSHTVDTNTSLQVAHLDGGRKWECGFGPIVCGVIFDVDVSAAVVKKHLKEFHGIDTRSAPTMVKCLWSEHGAPGCAADIRAKGLARHNIAHVHLRTGTEKCPYCRKKHIGSA